MNKKGTILIEVLKLNILPNKLEIDKIDLNYKGEYFSICYRRYRIRNITRSQI
jgi:hypothetical protein